ncbi:M1 family aminopeptidase, partial [Pirellulales bacterium]|nr:M1 family aminopeptidase [Pirellulales bacterium]
DEHLWTQGEPHESRHWYPCFDAPNERSSTEVICHVPQDMTVLSNGKQVAENIDPATRLKMVHWLQETPHVNYLICLVAGHLHGIHASHGDVPLAFYTQPSRAEFVESGFRDTAQIMAFYEKEIGVPYPWDKYYQVTIGDFMWGGMENTTLTTLHQGAVFSDEVENTRTNRRLDAHELAHQWFGDYLTCKDWSHLWLNEGFATYYTHLYDGHKFGRDAMLYGLYTDAANKIFANSDDLRPIVYRDYESPWDQFDFRAYPKGSWVLHMLRSKFGEKLFREAIQKYLEQHALTHVETEELRAAFEDVTGETLDRFFDQWVYHGGVPNLKIKYKWLPEEKLAHLSIRQTQETNDDVLLFAFQTKVRFTADGKKFERTIEVDQRDHDFYFKLPAKPEIVRFDPDYALLAEVDFEKSDSLLEAQLKDQSDVVGRLFACEALAERETNDAAAALKAALQNDPFFGVRIASATALEKIGDDNAYEALAASLQQPDARVRLHVVERLAKFYRSNARDLLLKIAREEANPAIAAAAIAGLDKYQGSSVGQALREALAVRTLDNEQSIAALRTIGRRQSAGMRGDVIAALEQHANLGHPEAVGAALSSLAKISNRPNRRKDVYDVIAKFVEHPRRQFQISAVRALGKLGDPRAQNILKPLARRGQPERLADAAEDALEKLDKAAPLAPKEVAALRREVRALRKQLEDLEEDVEEVEAKEEAE